MPVDDHQLSDSVLSVDEFDCVKALANYRRKIPGVEEDNGTTLELQEQYETESTKLINELQPSIDEKVVARNAEQRRYNKLKIAKKVFGIAAPVWFIFCIFQGEPIFNPMLSLLLYTLTPIVLESPNPVETFRNLTLIFGAIILFWPLALFFVFMVLLKRSDKRCDKAKWDLDDTYRPARRQLDGLNSQYKNQLTDLYRHIDSLWLDSLSDSMREIELRKREQDAAQRHRDEIESIRRKAADDQRRLQEEVAQAQREQAYRSAAAQEESVRIQKESLQLAKEREARIRSEHNRWW